MGLNIVPKIAAIPAPNECPVNIKSKPLHGLLLFSTPFDGSNLDRIFLLGNMVYMNVRIRAFITISVQTKSEGKLPCDIIVYPFAFS